MHVAINGWFAGQSATGSGQYLDHLLGHLPKQAPEVRWSLLLPARPLAPVAPPDGVQSVLTVLPRLPKNLAKLWWEQVAVPRLARRLHADVLWVPYWAAPLWQPVAVAVTVHDLIPALLPAYRGGWLQRRYTDLVSYTARRSAAVITVSEASARDIVKHLRVAAEQVFVVRHGPNQANTPWPDESTLAAVRQRHQLPDRFFLYLGGFDVRKNVPGTLAAYRRYLDRGGDPAVHLVIAGRLPENDSAFAPDPQKIAVDLGLTRQVHFCGWVDEADKHALYALSTAFIFPSRYEGFGMMVLEAMQAGTPVVTSTDTHG